MCTNYVPSRGERLREHFGLADPGFEWRDEAYPGYVAPIIRRTPDGSGLEVTPACFGLIPYWSRDGRNYRHCYNARSETVATKPSFRGAWRRGQFCLVPADAFFEPSYETGRAVRWRIARDDGAPFALAAIWDAWKRPPGDSGAPADAAALEGDWLISFSLLTLNADRHPVMRRFHGPDDEKRTVAEVPPAWRDRWLQADPRTALESLAPPDPADLVTASAPRPPRRAAAPEPPVPRPRTSGGAPGK